MTGPDMQQQARSTQGKISENDIKDGNASTTAAAATPAASAKPSFPVRLWKASGLDPLTLKLMFKGAIAPTIALAIYQANAINEIYSTLGYLVAIMSILSMPIMPRSKFIQNIFLDLLGVCIGSCIALLTIYSSVQARKHTTPTPPTATSTGAPTSGAVLSGYNSSASTVSAIWLFANIYVVNTLRASRPQLQLPVIMYSIFAMVASTYAPNFPTMAAGIAFVERLIEAFTLAFAIALGVNLCVFPMTCRGIFFKQAEGMVGVIQGGLRAQLVYVKSLEGGDVFGEGGSSGESTGDDEGEKDGKDEVLQKGIFHRKKKQEPKQGMSPQATALKAMVTAMGELLGKMYADISFAKRELAYGKLDAHAIEAINHHFSQIMMPMFGLSSVADIFHRVAQKPGWVPGTDSEQSDAAGTEDPNHQTRSARIRQWNEIMKTLHEPFELMTTAMCEGMQHVSLVLEFTKPPRSSKKDRSAAKASKDIEADAGIIKPGEAKYLAHLKEKIDLFYEQRQVTLNTFLKQIGIEGDADAFSNPAKAMDAARKSPLLTTEEASDSHKQHQRQLFMILYMEYLMWSMGRAILQFVEYADSKVEDGTMHKSRIIHPGSKRLQKWFLSLWSKEDMSSTAQTPDASEGGSAGVYCGASYQTQLDPEHLPPANAWERFTDGFRGVARVLGSGESAFGFRVACATLTIGVVAYLRETQGFFLEQRLVWAMIMVAIGMTTTAGAGIFGFIGRITGTVVAMCTSLVIWYIVNGHTAGVIVFFFVFTFFEFYCLIKFPKIMVVALLSIVTQVLILGYELQVQKTGIKLATSTGQPYYHIYLLAPYRLATVAGGMVVAFFWTFFPYPLTERSQLRKELGSALYLLANFYSVVHTTVETRIQGREGSLDDKQSPGHKLEKARRAVWEKEMALLASLRQHSAFTVWEPTFGGKFPKETYDAIIEKVSSLINYLSLLSYASKSLSPSPFDDSPPPTTKQQQRSRPPTSQSTTSTLTLLSAAVAQASPLPPYLQIPEPRALNASSRLDEGDGGGGILGVDTERVLEPGYAASVVMGVVGEVVGGDVRGLVQHVKTLVGEVDFSFHVHSSATSSEETLFEREGGKGKRD